MDMGPDLKPSSTFLDQLVSVNSLRACGFGQWLFLPGMLFGAMEQWWGDQNRRKTPHEGLDLHYYRAVEGNICHLDSTIKVPVMFSGRIVTVVSDFLGESVFVLHEEYASGKSHLYTIYGHIAPGQDLHSGKLVREGDIVGAISSGRGNSYAAPRHLHLSLAWVPDRLPNDSLTWKTMADPRAVGLVDPLSIMGGSYSLQEHL